MIQKKITISVVASGIAILGALAATGRYLLTPWFVTVATETLAGEIDKRIDSKTTPANNGIKAMLTANIEQLTDEVSMLNARRARDPARWSDMDVMLLSSAERRLNSAKRSLAEFERDAIQLRNSP